MVCRLVVGILMICFVLGLEQKSYASAVRGAGLPGSLRQPSGMFGSAAVSNKAKLPRKVLVVNNCKEPVRVGFTGGALTGKNWTKTTCNNQPGLKYDVKTKTCYWDTPVELLPPALNGTGNPDLAPGKNLTIKLKYEFTYTVVVNGTKHEVVANWNGALWGATGCSGKNKTEFSNGPSCDTGNCYYSGRALNQQGYCEPFDGPKGPGPTKFEFTLQPRYQDTYDVTTIGGVNLPMSVEPVRPKGMVFSKHTTNSGPYWCSSAGLTKKTAGIAANSWIYKSNDANQKRLLQVVAYKTGGNQDCDFTKHNDGCAPGHVCGVTLKFVGKIPRGPTNNVFQNKCGPPLGVTTYDGICKMSGSSGVNGPGKFPDYDSTLDCTHKSDLYGCKGIYSVSGYNPPVKGKNSCGCPDWKSYGIPAPATATCKSNSTEWLNDVLPQLKVFKQAAPSTYTFPFDDESATFTCKTEPSGSSKPKENLGYKVTFCPGVSQLPMVVH